MSEDTENRASPTIEVEVPTQESRSKPGAKPRASRAGTRSVSTLNAEQLARKRANDREAQRAIRQRTREHIERLESRIKELSENDPDSDAALEAMQRRNAELEEELRQLRRTLFGMGEGSRSPSSASQLRGYIPSPGPSMRSVPYQSQTQWSPPNQQMASMGYGPTSNPLPEADPSWQPPSVPGQHPRRTLPHQPPLGFHQSNSWSRTDSSDSDYDSGYTMDQERVPHPVGAYPDHIQDFMARHPQGGRNDGMWQTPTSSSGVSTPYEAQVPLPNIPQPRDDQHTRGMVPSFSNQTGTPEWGSPLPQSSDREAYF